MYDVNDDAKAGYRRVEVLTGPGRRRRWSAEEKARIVAEASIPGVAVSEVARRWQVCAQQVFGWRREAQRDMAQSAAFGASAFVPILAEGASMIGKPSTPVGAAIEVKLTGAVVRVAPGTAGALLTSVLRAPGGEQKLNSRRGSRGRDACGCRDNRVMLLAGAKIGSELKVAQDWGEVAEQGDRSNVRPRTFRSPLSPRSASLPTRNRL